MNKQQRKVAPLRRDLYLILALLFLSALLLLALFLGRETGERIQVTVNGVRVGEYSLTENAVYPLNGGTNLLVIEDGAAYMKEADCPDRTCLRVGRVRHTGERIVCLPHGITVTVVGGEETDLTV